MERSLKDAFLIETKALPNGAASTTSDPIDLETSSGQGDFVAPCEIEVSAPALAVGPMANGKTMIYDVEHSNSAASGYETLAAAVITQTGAGGVGAAAATKKIGIPSNAKRYIRLKATGSTTGDASGSVGTISLVF